MGSRCPRRFARSATSNSAEPTFHQKPTRPRREQSVVVVSHGFLEATKFGPANHLRVLSNILGLRSDFEKLESAQIGQSGK